MRTLALFEEAPYQCNFNARVLAVSEQGVALDQTLFYPTGGGQPGDQGHFLLPDGSVVAVVGTQRDPLHRSIIWHQLKEGAPVLSPDMELQGCLDWERRYLHMRMHTCLHLLCSIISAPVTGCSIGTNKGRLDFDLPDSTLDKEYITRSLNELINRGLEVSVRLLSSCEYDSLLEFAHIRTVTPALMQGVVRIVKIPGLDLQPCGGTHVRNIAEIGQVVCEKIEKKSRHNRRVTLRLT
ncbi:alanyl-tRNA editing protein [Metapseudomonas furukawaii]|uniref:alanyl-tRNA editing protein n=1 Tax=Metapseudomonas furukawaii TaxID=1149133 RepID=UPI00227C298A|nr:alanyl-tRNA editing protein [Pseudomonas furukawaii]WAG77353.1 alanyl-tRNA editing protein [Pseudomonas furukawaii]